MINVATKKDHVGMLAIYNSYITDTVITFECEELTPSVFSKRIQGFQEDYPCLVIKQQGIVVAYAYAHRMFERAAYQWDVELSVYCAKEYTKQGYGKALLTKLLDLLNVMGIINVYSLVTLPNEGSERLHKRLGFHKTGCYHQTGFKHGAWHDVGVFEKAIRAYPNQPKPFTKFPMLDSEVVERILTQEIG